MEEEDWHDPENWAVDWQDYLQDKPTLSELRPMITGFSDTTTVRGDIIEPDACDSEGYPAWTLVFESYPGFWDEDETLDDEMEIY